MTTRIGLEPVRVELPGGESISVRHLLGGGNFKQCLSEHIYPSALVAHLSLAPNVTASKRTVCPNSTAGCRSACLFYGGRGQLHTIRRARIARTVLFWQDPAAFMAILRSDLNRWSEMARRLNKRLFVSMNALSDLEWELLARWIFTDYPATIYYDYTKLGWRITSPHKPENYHIVLSRSERNEIECKAALARGFTVAVVFRGRFPRTFWGYPVHDGTQHDLRPLDPPGVIVGLKALGRARHDKTGFVVDA